MKINVRHELATEADDPAGSKATPDRAVVWVTGDDGETIDTKYLEDGQEITLDAAAVFGKPDEVPPAAATADEVARAHIATLLRRPEVTPEDRAAAEAFLKDEGGVQAAAEPVEPGAEAEQ